MENTPDKILHPKKNAMIEAMTKALGIVTTATNLVGISRQTHYEWLKNDPLYTQKLEEINAVALDFGERQLHSLVGDKNVTAVIYILHNKGRSREYSRDNNVMEEQEVRVRNVLYVPHDGRTDKPIDISYEEVNKLRDAKDNKDE